jgi:Mg2+/Co2+ transporter CorC
MHHRFTGGFITLFLSNDQIARIEGLSLKNRGRLSDHDEEARVDRYQYNVRNLDAINEESIMAMYEKVMQKISDFTAAQ